MQLCNMRLVFTVWWKKWADCEELKPKPNETWAFVERKAEADKHRTEWCETSKRYRC